MAGGTNTAQVAPFTRKDLQKPIALWKAELLPDEGNKLVGGNKIVDTESYIKMAQATRPIAPQYVKERQALPVGQYNKAATQDYYNLKFGLLLSFSRESWKDNQYPEVLIQRYVKDLLDLCHQVRDQNLVNAYFNLLDTTIGPDGVAIISNAHPLEPEAALSPLGITTTSNLLTGTVSVALLNLAVDMLKRQVDSKGQLQTVLPPVKVICDSQVEVQWNQVAYPVNSYQPFTADRNSGKPYSAMVASVIGLTRSTHPGRILFLAARDSDRFNFVWDRETPDFSNLDYRQYTDAWEANVIFRLGFGWFDWRGSAAAL